MLNIKIGVIVGVLSLGLGALAEAYDASVFTKANLASALNWKNDSISKEFIPLENIIDTFAYHRDPLRESQISAPGGWKFLGAYFDTPVIDATWVKLNILLNQTRLSHVDSKFVIERRSQVLQLILWDSQESSQKAAVLLACSDPNTFSSIYFQRPMTLKQLQRFIPNPLVALARAMGIGFGNIKHDPFGHFDQLMALFNRVEGVDVTLTPTEVGMVKNYTDLYKTLDAQFLPGEHFKNPCDEKPEDFRLVSAKQTLIF